MYCWCQKISDVMILAREFNTEKELYLATSAIEYVEVKAEAGYYNVFTKHGRHYKISEETFKAFFPEGAS